MAINPNEDTEFNDALRKHGILPPKQRTPSPSPPPSPTFDDILNDFSPSELQELSQDPHNDEIEREILAHRDQRLAKERKSNRRARFGRVYPIGRDDYTREVTEASKISEDDDKDETGTGVVCFLYKDGILQSDRATRHVNVMAERYPRTKFVSIVGDKCIANLPDSRIPMFIIYKNGEIRNQIVAWGADQERSVEELEAILLLTGALHIPERLQTTTSRKSNSDDEDGDDDYPSSHMKSAGSTNRRSLKNIRNNTKSKSNDSDSDFEFDL